MKLASNILTTWKGFEECCHTKRTHPISVEMTSQERDLKEDIMLDTMNELGGVDYFWFKSEVCLMKWGICKMGQFKVLEYVG